MNEYDSDRILDLAKKAGYLPTNNISETDCYILNTCHIREKATDKVYDDIGRVKKNFRGKKKVKRVNLQVQDLAKKEVRENIILILKSNINDIWKEQNLVDI